MYSGADDQRIRRTVQQYLYSSRHRVFGMVRYRIRYQKVGAVRFASHRDLLRVFRRSLAAADVPVCYSQGFNPHPKLSFGPSLRTGWESLDEYMDVLLERRLDDLADRCNATLPEGLKLVECAPTAEAVPKLSADITAARYEVTVDGSNFEGGGPPSWRKFVAQPAPAGVQSDLPGRLESALRSQYGQGRDDGSPKLLEINIGQHNGGLQIDYLSTMVQGKSLFADMLEPYMGDSLGMDVPLTVVRKELLVERQGSYHSPISKGVVQNQS